MGGSNSKLQTDGFRGEYITSTKYCSRPLGNKPDHGDLHKGVVVHTVAGNDWLIHDPGPLGAKPGFTVVTDASNMSNRWQCHPITVRDDKTVGQASAFCFISRCRVCLCRYTVPPPAPVSILGGTTLPAALASAQRVELKKSAREEVAIRL